MISSIDLISININISLKVIVINHNEVIFSLE